VEGETDAYPTAGDLRDCLRRHGIVYGIKQDVLQLMVDSRRRGERTLVAEGEPAVAGAPARFELLIDTSSRGKPQVSEDGRVDLRNLNLVVNVEAGQPLVKKYPATRGREGKTVFGEPIEPRAGEDRPFHTGAGTKPSDDDPLLLVAQIDGAAVVGADGRVEVVTSEIISSDIDYTTGNISFTGDLTIRGTVRAGFSVNARGNLRIGGNVEESEVACTGNLEIAGGAVGAGEGVITAGGSFKARLVERFTVRAGADVHIVEDVVHSTILAQGSIRARSIIGGMISAGESIEAEEVGAVAETRTTLEAGGTAAAQEQKQELMKEIEEFSRQLSMTRQSQYALVRDAMDEKGAIGVLDEKALEELWRSRLEMEHRRALLMAQAEQIDEKLKRRAPAYIKIVRVLPNTFIRFGSLGKLIKSTLLNVIFTVEEDRIKSAKF